MKTITPPIDLDAIAHRIQVARRAHGDAFAEGTIDFLSGELTPRPRVDIDRDLDRVALFREVRRLQLAGKDHDLAIQLVREALDSFTNPESRVDLRDWMKTARQVLKHGPHETTTDADQARLDTPGTLQAVRPASKHEVG